ncbi:hypothetical protein A3C98_01865 [Candidatus Roizmanbacteria bacterium RIFCSPHIGHO2_02_FULL_37_15]|uniref:Uncharacterized protein n=1 Tax=Candidatus Roizmanbacteria bacterium RIFCSPLOWO2_01_FULL_37_16 TaxID=1802058 RepID=A0A1F7IPM5_9BACT|nr:MAG: hypothetical protein A2859_01930 [Candidatus Roizmanbacteria bacterium RIFCSPHIGHO2_01_FULL_37_16b]OGK22147.1 MAG: hypothetical protein A3C98_01865 [Candidatus Roizmanbacteria bacterium RIFCSPHIGHO2_02_FULL_37_15]OGK34111.1 MAG: hypothetical protein A3F57_06730 [Candidatus Roizmanbacteria bacterium RIFCSPHIGHO2_12_FULL_36_11]OGK45318.1 MAG: hypothetical protein A3B40_05490 [Candidatus Roizmanbacteria bacterium RIFCSPLOWO2_01_FULL_37_16]OGK57127.1 MAG: hypothetical protein A3I50_02060 [C
MPKTQMAVALLLIFITAFINQPSLDLVFRFVLAVVFGICFEILVLKMRDTELFFPSATVVSVLIISLLLAPNLTAVELFVTIIISILSKHFLRMGKKHIFNPAAFGLLIGGLFFNHDVSWWGVSFQQLKIDNLFLFLSFLFLLLPSYISVLKLRRFLMIFLFLMIYSFSQYLLIKNIAIFDPTVIFFSLVMLPEPMTTPSKPIRQTLFGIFVAGFSFLVSSPILNSLPDPLIAGLLLGNFAFFKWR